MILVDTSVWIDFFNRADNTETQKLAGVNSTSEILLADMVLFEILQGARDDRHADRLERDLKLFQTARILDENIAHKAAANYRRLRAMGITVRKMANMIIGTYCIENGHSLLHRDRDFLPMVEHLGLKEF
jgi:predicted nucleic acid-binding protein